jgi:hypothetical protein
VDVARKKAPRIEVSASIRDLTFREQDLPWAHLSMTSDVGNSKFPSALRGRGSAFYRVAAALLLRAAPGLATAPRCAVAARRWCQRKAQARYRASDKGRECRRAQSRRRRERQRERRPEPGEADAEKEPGTGREGHHQSSAGHVGQQISCDRPGCSGTFASSKRSPAKRFCCAPCRKAFRQAWVRQKRWREICQSCPLRALIRCPGLLRES